MMEMSRNLTPGFRLHLEIEQGSSGGVKSLLRQSLRNPALGVVLAKRAIGILRREGYGGIKRRLEQSKLI